MYVRKHFGHSQSFIDKWQQVLPIHNSLDVCSNKPERYFSQKCVKTNLDRTKLVLVDPNPVRKKRIGSSLKHFHFDTILTDDLPKVSNFQKKIN